jgi:hypothetical protein
MKRTLLALALVAASGGVAYAQTSVDPNLAPGQNPKGMVMDSNTSAAAAAAKSKLEGAGFTGVHDLKRMPDGTWTGRAMKNNLDIAVHLDVNGNIVSH